MGEGGILDAFNLAKYALNQILWKCVGNFHVFGGVMTYKQVHLCNQLHFTHTEEEIMANHALESQESYNPNHLLDTLLDRLKLKNDAALSRILEVAPPVISKIRHRRLPIGASLLIRMHEVTDLSIRELRDLMGDRRTKYRLSDAQGKPKLDEQVTASESHYTH